MKVCIAMGVLMIQIEDLDLDISDGKRLIEELSKKGTDMKLPITVERAENGEVFLKDGSGQEVTL